MRESERALRRVLWSLREILPQVVLMGGWVPYLHQRYGGFRRWSTEPVFTEEVDVLLPGTIEPEALRTLAGVLREAGFRPSHGVTPAAEWIRDIEEGERLEFFVPHTGPAHQLGAVRALGRDNEIAAVTLHGLEALLEHTIQLRVPTAVDVDARFVTVTVPELAAFVVQKSASYPRRSDQIRQAKDLFYLVEILAGGDEVERSLAARMRELCADSPAVARDARAGKHNLRSVINVPESVQPLRRLLSEMVQERYGLPPDAAEAKAVGYLQDMLEILQSHCSD